ncbi:COG4315 family predicted lipoprotein [Pseudobacillus wudalianchiensis]|uniref:Lipoprotein n=1 Tax=Pseudobacillus wudalianchiensis TaxID=1743143 RepID=A0A1B9AT22_9BACI|nr:hypothetical protein [Bacillus wudalianchiensis]OCA87075.1 hypothetical protein A8F95_07305 [Bacillus wudalianchiensis]
MNKKRWMVFLFSALILLAACGKSDNAAEPTSDKGKDAAVETAAEETQNLQLLKDQSAGEYLADSKGMTLYYFKKDEEEKSHCSGECLEKWPPFTESNFEVPAGFEKEDFGTITREDNGQQQVTYKGYPLYYFAGDKQEGDLKGQGVKSVWYIINKNTTFQ